VSTIFIFGGVSVKIKIRYLSVIREKTDRREDVLDLPAGSALQAAADWLAVNRNITAPSPLLMATLNGRGWNQLPDGLASTLKDGDEIALFPLVSGG
jgi:molybdopterin converting factor small subunit